MVLERFEFTDQSCYSSRMGDGKNRAIIVRNNMLLHHCYCGRWGAYGFGFSARLEQAGTWLCREHKAEGDDIVMYTEDDYYKRIPTRYRSICDFCGRELDTREPGTHQFTSGWVKNRQGGGGHGISLPKRENRWAHGHCIDHAIKGHEKQESLF